MHQLVIKSFQHCLMHGVNMKFLRGSLPLLSPAFGSPQFAARCLHVRNDARDPSSERWNYGRERLRYNMNCIWTNQIRILIKATKKIILYSRTIRSTQINHIKKKKAKQWLYIYSLYFKLNTKYITISQNTTKIIVLCCTICFTTTCFGPFL